MIYEKKKSKKYLLQSKSLALHCELDNKIRFEQFNNVDETQDKGQNQWPDTDKIYKVVGLWGQIRERKI